MEENEKKSDAQELMKNELKYPERAIENMDIISQGNNSDIISHMPVAMATYAGPDFMNNGGIFYIPESAQQNNIQISGQPEDPDKKVCRCCGHLNFRESGFCTECGNILDRSE